MRAAALVAAMSAVTILLRFLPFLVFRKRTPPYIAYLGRVLPAAIIGMLVVYCLKDVSIAAAPHGILELAAAACVVLAPGMEAELPGQHPLRDRALHGADPGRILKRACVIRSGHPASPPNR